MSRDREQNNRKGGGANDSFNNESSWVAAAKSASFSNGDKSGGSALSEYSCDAVSIMEFATDLFSPSERNAQDQDVFTENPKESPLRNRRMPTQSPSRIRSKRHNNFSAEQRLANQSQVAPNWEGTTITADARKCDEVSVMTPFGGDIQLNRNNHKTAPPSNKHAASEASDDNWDKFELSIWDTLPEQNTHFSESEEGFNAAQTKQPVRQKSNKRKLIWIGSVAVLLIAIVAITIPFSRKSQNTATNTGSENLPVEFDDTTLTQPAATEEEPTVAEDEVFINGQATKVPMETNPSSSSPQAIHSPVNEPMSSTSSTGAEQETNGVTTENEPISLPISNTVESQPTLAAPVPAENNLPIQLPAPVEVESPSPPIPAENNVPAPVPASVVGESQPSPPASAPVQNDVPAQLPAPVEVELPSPSPPAPVPADNNVPAPLPASVVGESQPSPPASAPVQNDVPAQLPASEVQEVQPPAPFPMPTQNDDEPVSSPVSTVVELSIQEDSDSTPNNEPNESSNNQQVNEPNSPAQSQSSASQQQPISPQTAKPTQLPTLPPTPSCINVQIKADNFGHETSWVLRDVDRNKVIGSVPVDTYDANEEDSQDFCGLESGKYKFTIRDKYGDGICCGNGRGKYRVFLNGRQIIVGGYFKKELSFDILIGYDPGTLTDREYQYWVGHNRRRKEFHEKHGTEYVPLAWSHTLADRARAWATTLLGECDDVSMRHDPNRNGDGENMAKNLGNSATAGLGQLYPVENIMARWVEREMEWDWPENAHLTQALWRGSTYVGCADVEETKSDGSICRVQVCRYRRSGNCDMKSFNGNWLEAMLQDHSSCGEQCPQEGCYVTSSLI